MKTVPWAHQTAAVDRLVAMGGSGACFAEMGCGKTLIALLLAERLDAKRVCVLCPKAVRAVWGREPERHAPGEWNVYAPTKGTAAQKAAGIAPAAAAAERLGKRLLVVVNYETMIQPAMHAALKAACFDLVIMDESHRLKAPAGVSSRLASQIADRCAHRVLLTGTPMPHSPLDVYGQFRACDKLMFGVSFVAFRARYARLGGYEGKEVVGYQHLDELEDKLDARAVRIRTDEVHDLPPVTDIELPCELPLAARRVYREMEEQLTSEVEAGTITASNGLTRLLRLQQITNGSVRIEDRAVALHTAKADVLASLLEDLAPSWDEVAEPIVVFGQFHADLDTIATAGIAAGRRVGELSGRRNDCPAWDAGDVDLLVVQIQAGSLGVDFTRARYCVFYGPTWNYGEYLQARKRVHRPGQTRPVTYYHILAEDSMDGVVQRALSRKRNVVEAVLANLKGQRDDA